MILKFPSLENDEIGIFSKSKCQLLVSRILKKKITKNGGYKFWKRCMEIRFWRRCKLAKKFLTVLKNSVTFCMKGINFCISSKLLKDDNKEFRKKFQPDRVYGKSVLRASNIQSIRRIFLSNRFWANETPLIKLIFIN